MSAQIPTPRTDRDVYTIKPVDVGSEAVAPSTARILERELFVAISALAAGGGMPINHIARLQFDWVERMGWHQTRVLERLAMVASEVGEAVNECRMEEPTPAFGSELADIILRTVDIAQAYGVDIGAEISRKMAINEERGSRGRLK